jgi:Arc/MetJ-type ribon-helix-helix transcriptional regulator
VTLPLKFQNIHGPGLKQFRHEMPRRWPEIQHLGISFEDASGHSRGGLVIALDDQGDAVGSDITHVMVRLKAPELEIVDTLITAGIANSRAEAIRWALARISERARLRAAARAHPRYPKAHDRILTGPPHIIPPARTPWPSSPSSDFLAAVIHVAGCDTFAPKSRLEQRSR